MEEYKQLVENFHGGTVCLDQVFAQRQLIENERWYGILGHYGDFGDFEKAYDKIREKLGSDEHVWSWFTSVKRSRVYIVYIWELCMCVNGVVSEWG